MKILNKIASNPIVRAIVLILLSIVITILTIAAIPYAIVRGACNLEYYGEWADFIFKYLPTSNKQ